MCWADMTFSDRAEWFALNGDAIAKARGAFVAALEDYGRAIRASGAFERDWLTVEQYLNQVLDSADAPLAEEVQEYLGC